jgi:FtsH-binding integral membrane protein
LHKILNYQPSTSKNRKIGQKITLFIAYSCYLGALVSIVISFYLGKESTQTPVFASFIAITVFCACVGILLHVLGSGNLPSLKIDDHPNQKVELGDNLD